MLNVLTSKRYLFEFEKSFSFTERHEWMAKHWHFSIYLSIFYTILVFGLQSLMHHRQPFNLKMPLFFWNVVLATFSIAGTARLLPELIHTLMHQGFKASACDISFMTANLYTRFWTWAFIVSKAIELGDTIFIVLRKQPLTFLHWCHHVVALISCFYSYGNLFAAGRWTAVMNLVVHSVMYVYFALRSLKISVSRTIAKGVTCLQLFQFLVGFIVGSRTIVAFSLDEACYGSFANAVVCTFVYGLNLALFGLFFRNAYMKKHQKVN